MPRLGKAKGRRGIGFDSGHKEQKSSRIGGRGRGVVYTFKGACLWDWTAYYYVLVERKRQSRVQLRDHDTAIDLICQPEEEPKMHGVNSFGFGVAEYSESRGRCDETKQVGFRDSGAGQTVSDVGGAQGFFFLFFSLALLSSLFEVYGIVVQPRVGLVSLLTDEGFLSCYGGILSIVELQWSFLQLNSSWYYYSETEN